MISAKKWKHRLAAELGTIPLSLSEDPSSFSSRQFSVLYGSLTWANGRTAHSSQKAGRTPIFLMQACTSANFSCTGIIINHLRTSETCAWKAIVGCLSRPCSSSYFELLADRPYSIPSWLTCLCKSKQCPSMGDELLCCSGSWKSRL